MSVNSAQCSHLKPPWNWVKLRMSQQRIGIGKDMHARVPLLQISLLPLKEAIHVIGWINQPTPSQGKLWTQAKMKRKIKRFQDGLRLQIKFHGFFWKARENNFGQQSRDIMWHNEKENQQLNISRIIKLLRFIIICTWNITALYCTQEELKLQLSIHI